MRSEGGHERKAILDAVVRVVQEMRQFDPKMEMGQFLVYLLVAENPGIKMTDLVSATGLSRSAVSRNVLALSKETYREDGGKKLPGHDLVTALSDPFDARAKVVAPTRRGEWLADRIIDAIKRGVKIYGEKAG